MNNLDIIKSITNRTGGDLYLGVVGAVRTGKSTFIKKFIENLVIPHIEDESLKKRCLDEIPQSAQGKTIMTTEPKFIPSQAANIKIEDFEASVRLVDCVGYVVEGAKGYEDENGPRMVKTPWYDEEIPFIEAAEIGTSKVIKDHSSIGIVVTTDGSFSEIKRDAYVEAEQRIVSELKSIGKPFIVILNTSNPNNPETISLTNSLREEYDVPVIPISILDMNEKDVYAILKEALYEFPVLEVQVNMPDWIACLEPSNWLKEIYISKIRESVCEVDKLRDTNTITAHFDSCEYIDKSYVSNVDTSTGVVTINLDAKDELYNQILKEIVGIDINSRADIISLFQDYNTAKQEYDQIKTALKMVKTTGYGVASPSISDMKLETPEVIKQGSRYGIKLKAVAPSIHIGRIKRMLTVLLGKKGIAVPQPIRLNIRLA